MEQLNRFRFRHRPIDYLAALEMRWEQITGTSVLPHSLKRPVELIGIVSLAKGGGE